MVEGQITTRFLVTCIEGESCIVAFEPEGAVHTLRADDAFVVEMAGSSPGVPEVNFSGDGITLCAWSGADTRAWDRSGKELRL